MECGGKHSLSFDSTFSSSLSSLSSSSWALTYYVVAINTSLDAPSPLSLRHRLYRHAAATIVAPMPVSLRLSRASGWLLHRHISRRANASLVVPAPLSLHRHLSLRRGLSCSLFTTSLIAPPSPQNMHPNKWCPRSLARPNQTTPEYHNLNHGVAVGRPWRFCIIAPIAFVGGMGGWCCRTWCAVVFAVVLSCAGYFLSM